MKILIIDNHEDTLAICSTYLTAEGHQVQSAPCGANALRIAREFLPHVILCDIATPEMNGFSVARIIRDENSFIRPCLIAFTGYDMKRDDSKAVEAGFDAVIAKPVDFASFARAIQQHCDDAKNPLSHESEGQEDARQPSPSGFQLGFTGGKCGQSVTFLGGLPI